MEPTFKDLKIKKTLLNSITVKEKNISEVNINKLILRPVMKRIVFLTEEFDRVIVYDGSEAFEAHKEDSEDVLITALLQKIDSEYKK